MVAAPVLDYAPPRVNHQFTTAECPWKGSAVQLPGVTTAKEALKRAGLDWIVHALPMYVELQGRMREVPDRRALVRDAVRGDKERDRFLTAGVSDHYQVLQNERAFSFFDRVVREGAAMYEAAGSFFGGRVVFIVARLPQDILVDDRERIEGHVLLVNSHDGSRQMRMGYLPILARTQTILGSAMPRGFNVAIRHIGMGFDGRVAEARRALGIIKTWNTDASALFTKMARSEAGPQDVDKYLRAVFPDKKSDEKKAAEQNRYAVKAAAGALQRFSARAQPVDVFSLYSATCSVVEQTSRPRTKLSSNWFGDRARLKEKAMALAARMSA